MLGIRRRDLISLIGGAAFVLAALSAFATIHPDTAPRLFDPGTA